MASAAIAITHASRCSGNLVVLGEFGRITRMLITIDGNLSSDLCTNSRRERPPYEGGEASVASEGVARAHRSTVQTCGRSYRVSTADAEECWQRVRPAVAEWR